MREVAANLYAIVDKYLYWINLPKITVIDVIEIIIIAVVLYYVMAWLKNSRAGTLLRGIIIILIFVVVAAVFRMNTILWLAGNLASIAVIALVIIFQPELRIALENLGRQRFFSRLFRFDSNRNVPARMSEKSIQEIVEACKVMSEDRTGALIVVEKDEELKEYAQTGIDLDALVSSQLLINIFEENTPLHDGAVIVRGERVVAATCYLPLSDNMKVSKRLGTRHRAALGISEVSDSLTIVISEETGAISVAVDARLYEDVDDSFLLERMEKLSTSGLENDSFIARMRRWAKTQNGESGQDAPSSDESERRADNAKEDR